METKNTLFYTCIGLIILGFYFTFYNWPFRGPFLTIGLFGIALYFTAKTIKDIVKKRNNFLFITLQIFIVLMSLCLFTKYLHYGFMEYPSLIIIPAFIISTITFLILGKDKNLKITISSLLYIIITLPLFAFNDYFDSQPNMYIPYQWQEADDEIMSAELPYKFQYKETEQLKNDGFELRKISNFQEAIVVYKKALKLEPNNQYLLFDLSTCYNKYADLDIALSLLNSAINIDSSCSYFFNNRGIIYYKLSNEKNAISDFNKAIQLNPIEPAFYCNLAVTFYSERKYYSACEAMEKSEKLGLKIKTPKLIKKVKRIKDKCE